jgi:hypothetical protein
VAIGRTQAHSPSSSVACIADWERTYIASPELPGAQTVTGYATVVFAGYGFVKKHKKSAP